MYEYTEYKGNKILVLKREADDNYPFSFGRAKAKLIVEHFEVIRNFAKEGEPIQKTEGPIVGGSLAGTKKRQKTLL